MSAAAERDVVIVGAGTAGLPAAIGAAERGLRVTLVEKLDRVGGTLHVAAGQMSAAGTSLQRERGIDDSPDRHFADVMRISRGTADAEMVRLAVDLAPSTIEWLRDNDFDFHPDCPATVAGHEAYSVPRSHWGTDKALSILRVLERKLAPLVANGAVDLALGTRLSGLLHDGDGAVAGIFVRDAEGRERDLRAPQVALTAGGYGGNPALFERLEGMPLYGPLPEAASGEATSAALAAGAAFRRPCRLLPSYGGIEDPPASHRVAVAERPVLQPRLRQPWEIHVNRAGARFVAEDEAGNDVRERALLAQPGAVFWIVYDARIAREAPPLLPGIDAERLERRFRAHPSFTRAPTLPALARAAGIDESGLVATIAAYNAALVSGEDSLGRRHLPCPIAEPPYFALRNHGVAVKSAGGIDVDRSLRVRRADGTSFRNLFAAGEAIGGSLLSGNAFVGGMSLTPWLSFGRLLGRTLG